ncbi:putative ribonuclease H-like domain-containing protein [Tanacetum coccineum]
MRMRQYICHTHHNLWDVIVNEDLEEELAPSTGETSAPPAPKTAKQLFYNVADAKSLWEAIKSRFGGNVESKKMQKNVLKHQFENFSTASNESLDKAYDRFQKLISQLEVHGAPISKEDINQKFLRSLPSSWNQIALIMRNKPDIDEIDIDDLYNNLRVYEDELKRSSGSISASQNLAFLSSKNTGSTNEVSNASGDFGVSAAGGINQMDGDDLEKLDLRWQVAMLTVRVKKFIQRIGRNVDFKEKQPISLDKSKIECYNCHRKGHFARECRSGKSQGRRSFGDNGRSNTPTNESSSHALVAQYGLGGYDWSNDFEAEPVNYALIAISSSSSSSSSNSKVQKCYKQCLESFKCLQKNYDTKREKHNKAKLEIRGYEIALESLESRILGHEKNELPWGEKYEFQNYELKCREIKINNSNLELEKVVKERDELKNNIAKSEDSTKNLDEILNNQMSAIDKTGLGYSIQLNELRSNHETDSENSFCVFDGKSSDEESTPTNDRSSKADGYKVVPPPITGNFLTPRAEISFAGLDEYAIRNIIIESQTSELNTKISETTGVLIRTGFVSAARPSINIARPVNTASPSISTARPSVSTARPSINLARPVNTASPSLSTARPSINTARPVNTSSPSISIARPVYASRPIYPRIDNIIPRGSCSPIKRSYYTKPASRPKDLKQDIKTFGVKNMTTAGTRAVVNTVEPHYAFKKGNPDILLHDHAVVDSGCSSHLTDELSLTFSSVLYNGFKLLDESQVVLRAPRKDDVYSLDLKNIVPCGESINKKRYCLVMTDDISRLRAWEFKNHAMNEFCAKKGIKREFNVARTLQRNGVAERKNRTLIEAARTMALVTTSKIEILDLLIDQPNVAGTGPNWMFDLDFLTNSMNYVPVSVENQVNMDADVQDSYVAEKPSENASPDKDIQDSEDVINKEGQHQMPENEQPLIKKRGECILKEALISTDRPSVSTDRSFVSTDRSNTPNVSTASTPTGANAGESSFVYLGGKIPIDASTLPNADLPIDPNMPDLEDASDTLPNDGIFNGAYDDDEDVGAVADFNNMDNTIAVSPIPTLRIHKDHPKGQILGDPTSAVQTRGKIQKASSAQQALVSYIHKQNRTNHKDHQNCLFACFLSQEEPKTISQALQDESWVEAMQEELLQFKLQKVWVLVDLPYGKKVIGTKWVFRNKRDERSIVVKNKAWLVAQGFRQEEGIDYDEVFVPVAKIEAIRLFLAFASYMGFTIYQMDVKSAFIYGTIEEEVYVHQPPDFVDPAHPNKVYKVIKALYGLHQDPRAYYETLSSFLMENGFRRGTIDKTLFIKRKKSDIMLVQVYVDDIIFGSTKKSMCTEFEECFVDPAHPNKVYKVIKALYGLHQAPRAWYETLSSFLMENGFRRGTIDKTLFIKKKKSDIMLVQVYVDDIIFGSTKKSMCTEFEECMHKRFQMSSMGELTFFLGLQVKQQSDGIFISQDKYVADILKKFDFLSIRTATTPIESNKPLVKDENGVDVDVHVYRSMIGSLMYLTASSPDIMFAVYACARFQVTPKASYLNAVKKIFRYLKHQPKLGLWYPRDSPFELEAYSDSDYGGASLDRKSTTGGCQFLRRRLISWQCKKQTIVANSTTEAEYVAAANCCGQVLWIQNQMMDYGFNFMNTKIHIDNESTISVIKNPVAHSRTKHIEIRFYFIRDYLLTKGFDVTRFNFLVDKHGIEDRISILTTFVQQRVHMVNLKYSDKHNMVAFLKKPNENVGFTEVVDFLKVKILANGTQQLVASIDSKEYTITKAPVRSKLQLADAIGIHNLSDAEIYAGLATLGPKSDGWDQFGSTVATALICLSSNRVYNFSKMIFDGMVHNLERDFVPLLPAILAGAAMDQGEGSVQPTEPHHTLVDPLPSTSLPPIPSPPHQSPPHSPHQSPPHSPLQSPPYSPPRVTSLEKELKETKQTLGNVVLKLVKKVKSLELALKRKSKKVIMSELEGKELEDQGRIIQDIDDDPLVSLVRESMKEKSTDFVTPTKASREAQEEEISPTILEAAKTLSKVASQSISKAKSTDKGKRYRRRARVGINTGIKDVNTDSTKVDTGRTSISTSPKKGQRERKAQMVEEDIQATHKTKE